MQGRQIAQAHTSASWQPLVTSLPLVLLPSSQPWHLPALSTGRGGGARGVKAGGCSNELVSSPVPEGFKSHPLSLKGKEIP